MRYNNFYGFIIVFLVTPRTNISSDRNFPEFTNKVNHRKKNLTLNIKADDDSVFGPELESPTTPTLPQEVSNWCSTPPPYENTLRRLPKFIAWQSRKKRLSNASQSADQIQISQEINPLKSPNETNLRLIIRNDSAFGQVLLSTTTSPTLPQEISNGSSMANPDEKRLHGLPEFNAWQDCQEKLNNALQPTAPAQILEKINPLKSPTEPTIAPQREKSKGPQTTSCWNNLIFCCSSQPKNTPLD